MSTFIIRNSILALILLVFSFSLHAKESEDKNSEKKLFYGVYVDYDLGDVAMSMIMADRFGMNASVEVDLWHLLFPAFEMGYEKYDGAQDYSYLEDYEGDMQYKMEGLYYKIGVNFNLLQKDYTKTLIPQGFVGVRFCFAPSYSFDISGYPIIGGNEAKIIGTVEPCSGKTSARWGEFVAGVRTPIYKGLCLGAEVRFRQFLKIKDSEDGGYLIHNSYAPGYGDKEDGRWGFRYTISYFFH